VSSETYKSLDSINQSVNQSISHLVCLTGVTADDEDFDVDADERITTGPPDTASPDKCSLITPTHQDVTQSSGTGWRPDQAMRTKSGPNEVRFTTPPVTGSETQETIASVMSHAGESTNCSSQRDSVATSSTSTSTSISRQRDRSERREMRATIRMAVIIGVFCAMWLGFFTIYVARGVGADSRLLADLPRWLDAFLFWLGYANSTVNPVLYAVFNVEFRRAFQTIMADLCCRCCPAIHRRLTKHHGKHCRTR